MSEAQFKKAVEIIRNLPKDGPAKVSQSQQIKVYGLYKQATEGDCNISRPGMLDFTGRAKWDGWNAEKGKSKEQAMKDYVDVFMEIFKPLEDDAEYAKYIQEVQNAA